MTSTPCRVIPIPLGSVNSYLIIQESAMLVDTGMPGSGPKIIEALQQQSVTPEALRLIIITHGHTDHIGGLAAVKRWCDAPVAVHRNDVEGLRQGTGEPVEPLKFAGRLLQPLIQSSKLAERLGFPTPVPIEPDVIVDDAMSLRPCGVEGRVIHTPGHTAGSLSVLLESGEALIGDLVMPRFFAFGGPDYPLFGTSRETIRQSMQRVLATGPTTLYAAHGGAFDAQAVARELDLPFPEDGR